MGRYALNLDDYFHYAGRQLFELLGERASDDYGTLVEQLLEDSALPQLCLDLYAETTPRPASAQLLRHGISTFVYDAPSAVGLDGTDRVVAAFARSQRQFTIDELRRELVADPDNVDPAALSALHFTIRGHLDAWSARRRAALESAIADVMRREGIPRESTFFDRVPENPSHSLLQLIASKILPLLPAFRPPRTRAAQRQYRSFDGMTAMDVGHFVAHAAGGHYDINTFPQNSRLNRGHSSEGIRYRAMENFISSSPGRFQVSRPVYLTESWVPDFIELSVLVTATEAASLCATAKSKPTIGHTAVSPIIAGHAWWIGIFRNQVRRSRATAHKS